MINFTEFEILYYLHSNASSIRDTENALGFGNVESVLNGLLAKGFVEPDNNENMSDSYIITNLGVEALEPYRVKRAIFLAAGFGSRLVPVTLSSPKPLINVNGIRLIDRMLDAVLDAGIEEIYIVRGYLKESFDSLLSKYPMIKFIDNDIYNITNNISSAYIARNLMQNALVLESDLLLNNSKIIRPFEYRSMYMGIPMEYSDDWILKTDENSRIIDIGIEGRNTNQMVGISYWTLDDAVKLSGDLKTMFENESGKQLYWDEVALKYNPNKYDIYLRTVTLDDIVEIDTFEELCVIDPRYTK